MYAQEKIAVIKAQEDGKTIEYRERPDSDCALWPSGQWLDSGKIEFNFQRFEYRVKPKPRDFWLDSHYVGYGSKYAAEQIGRKGEIIHVREVLND